MKVNFWQIVGAVLIIGGVIFAFRSKTGKTDTTAPPSNSSPAPAATGPATTQSA